MENDRAIFEGVHDDPNTPDYQEWRSLIGQIVVELNRGAYQPISCLELLEVLDGRINIHQVCLLLRRWPYGDEMWVGWSRDGAYAMSRRPDGGFDVAGRKFRYFDPAGMKLRMMIRSLAPRLEREWNEELNELLQRPRGEVLPVRPKFELGE